MMQTLQRDNWVGPPAMLGEGWRLYKTINCWNVVEIVGLLA